MKLWDSAHCGVTTLGLLKQSFKCLVVAGLFTVSALHVFSQAGAPAVSCDSLAKAALPDTRITLAQSYAEGEYVTPPDMQTHTPAAKLPAICRVLATITTSSDSEVKAEVWLPQSGWNGNMVGATYPGRPVVQHNELIDGVRSGYAAVMIDGLALDRWAAAAGHPEQLIDDGYRGMHLITVTGKALIKAFYGRPAKYSVFLGCSEGGREGLNEAHHYPEDYDGISIGGAGHIFANINAAQLYPAWLVSKNPARFLSEKKWNMVHEAVVKACDGLDGVIDGVIEDPRECHFDVKQLQCKGEEADDCLTAPQVEFLQLIYKGTINPRTKEVIFEGPAFGSELKIIEFANDKKPMYPALELYKSLVFGDDPNWDLAKMDMDKDVALATQKIGPYLHTEPKDLKAFFARGGKLIVWDGWNDYNSPNHWINFGNEVGKLYGPKTSDASLRLYFSAGMDHCFGGAGCDTFDKLGAIAGWVETGKAPESMKAAHYQDGKVEHTRLMCAYPLVDKYKGTGDTKDAANWTCAKAGM
jgi:feruloyl esterase